MEAAKLIIEVVCGLVPQEPMPEYTRRFGLSSSDVEAEGTAAQSAWDRVHGEAVMYALGLMHPSRTNWVRLDWIWL